MLRLLFIGTLLCGCVTLVHSQQKSNQKPKKVSIAVIEFNSGGGLTPLEINTLTNRFRGMLVQTDAYNVIEREQMNAILKEQDFTLTDNCNSAECAVQVGQLLGVEEMIAGDIGKVGKTYTIDLRKIDISTGKIVKTQSENFKGEIDGMLEVMTDIAYSFAGKKNPNPPKTAYGKQKKSNAMWYVLGAAVIGGGGAYFLLGGAKKGGVSDIETPSFPANP